MERSLVLIKPDSIKKGIVGRIISRFEDTGLKIIAMKMLKIDEEQAKKHYILDEAWAKNVFEKAKISSEKENHPMKYKTPMEMGREIQKRSVDFVTEGPVIAMILEGPHAVEILRKMIGHTEPKQALPGTIRGDFSSIESYAVADAEQRAIRTLVHASDSVSSAEREIPLWFRKDEIMN
ncbi:MAG TPA: nucleoside-diphosphate kinase [Patescibacteria group bacterium]|nr:nucleoside-diphosphate kinase [Patescibacteria group bacterium]